MLVQATKLLQLGGSCDPRKHIGTARKRGFVGPSADRNELLEHTTQTRNDIAQSCVHMPSVASA